MRKNKRTNGNILLGQQCAAWYYRGNMQGLADERDEIFEKAVKELGLKDEDRAFDFFYGNSKELRELKIYEDEEC